MTVHRLTHLLTFNSQDFQQYGFEDGHAGEPPSRARLPELFEQGHELQIGADRVEIGARRDLLGAPPAAFEDEAKGIEGAVGRGDCLPRTRSG
jgi:hypothetical protein